ncbi:MAG: DUF1344 domain-containing protein [Candidatus Rokuibacteriota bacterium]
MRKIVGLTLALLLVLSSAPVWAADIEGKIQKVDSADRVIVLEDGTRLSVAEGMSLDNLKEGTKVKASYEERDGKKVLTNVQVSE